MNEYLSYIEISGKKLTNNTKRLRHFLGGKIKIAGVVKANAYGHGQNEVIKILDKHVDYFQLDDIEELRLARKITSKPILILGYVSKNNIEEALNLSSILGIYDIERLKIINKIGIKNNLIYPVHIKIDSFLGRQGILPEDLPEFLQEAKKLKNINIDGVYSHFANIEDTSDPSHADKQITSFNESVEIFEKFGFKDIKTHISATSGALVYEKIKATNQIVRIGIGLYGMWPSEDIRKKLQKTIELQPIIKWVTHIAQIKTLAAGHTIGYGLTYTTTKPTKIAIIPQGYSDGYDRGFSNCGEVLIAGKKCRVLGRVAMNMFVADVSKIKNVKTEDEVVLLGEQKGKILTAEELAQKIGTINYEITTRISPLLPKIIK